MDSDGEQLIIYEGTFSKQTENKGLRNCAEMKSLIKLIPTNLKLVQSLYAELLINAYKIWTDKRDPATKQNLIKKLIKNAIKNEEYPRNFKYIQSNMYKSSKIPKKIDIDDVLCACYPSCFEHCNRKLLKPSYNELTAFYHKEKGWGVKTLVPLCKGEFIVELCGKIWLKKNSENLDKAYLVLFGKYVIDCSNYSNIGRLVNHSCQPNSMLRKFVISGVEHVGIFAIKKIKILEEITFRYTDNLSFVCSCGEPNCISNE